MPIKGLSTRDDLDPRFKEIGRLRKGAAKNGNRPGPDLEYFRFVPDGDRADILRAFLDAYGKEPTHLQVYFPFDTMERNFSSWREEYGSNRLCKLRCDGERWHDWVDGDRHYHSRDGQECDRECRDSEAGCPGCPAAFVGRLSVILPELWYAGFVGLVTVLTSSKNDIATLAAKLAQNEPLTGKPFVLWRESERIGVPIKGKRAGVDKSLLHLELTEERLLLEFNAAREQAVARLEAPRQPTVNLDDESPDIDYDGELLEGDEFLEGDFHGAPPDPDTREDLREDEQEQASHEWTADEAAELIGWTRNELVITDKQTLDALGVSKISECTSTPDEARAIIHAYLRDM